MKKAILITFIALLIISAVYYFKPFAFASGKLKLSKKMIAKEKIEAGLKFGKSEFYNAKLGTDGFSCAKCHVDSVGTYIPMAGKVVRSLAGVAATFPRFNPKTRQVITLGERLNMCIVHALKGKPLSGQKLNDITLYVTSLSNGYKIKGYNAEPSPVFTNADRHPKTVQQALTLGKHYYDTPLGASGKSCDSCHPGGGAGILGGKPTKPVIGHAGFYPTYKKWGNIITMQDQFNHCIYTGEDGFKKKIGSKTWKYLDLYVYSLSKGYKIKVGK
ncbi:MAG: hypothetical protein ACYCS0_09325 [bacterium]